MDKVFEQAVTDFYHGRQQGPLLINNSYGSPDEMDLAVYFREEEDLSDLELYALSLVNGITLDVGAGAGALTLILQNRGIAVEALEQSAALTAIMKEQEVKKIIHTDFFTFIADKQYDTLLLLMNGLGICRTVTGLAALFTRFDQLLAPGGQVLFDSSNVRYVYEENISTDHYFGEMAYQYEYQGQKGNWFTWLYMDIDTLKSAVSNYNFNLQILTEDKNGQYLGRLTRQ